MAQSESSRQGRKIPLSGQIVDESNGNHLAFASVRLHLNSDSSLVAGSLTDDEGKFTFESTPGRYYLLVNFLGYANTYIDVIIEPGIESLELGTLKIKSEDVSLDEVTITSEKNQMELRLDKRIFNVSKDIANAGSSATEILQNLPSVEVDTDGNVLLRGSENVRILIDGKPSGLVGIGDAEALRLLQGNMIENIEIITNPSARYEAEGEVGIINIILKKEKKQGINGSFEVGTGVPHDHSLSANVNFRRKKVNLFSSLGVSYDQRLGNSDINTRFIGGNEQGIFLTDAEREFRRGGPAATFRFGSDFFLNDYNTITASGLYRIGDGQNSSDVRYRDFNEGNEVFQEVIREQDEQEDEHNVEFALNYRKTFPQKDRVWTVDFQYVLSDETERADIFEDTISRPSPTLFQRSSNTEDEQNMLFQTDYVHPIGKSMQFETGLRAGIRHIDNAYLVEQRNDGEDWQTLGEFNNDFQYDEGIYAGYAIFSHEIKKFSYQLGLRSEYTDIQAELTRTRESNNRSFLNFFPSVFLSYEVNANHTFQLNYSRRISRPNFRYLLPFSNFSDARNFRAGNPDLNPEFTNSFEATYLGYWESGSWLSSVYFRNQNQVIQRFTVVDEAGFATSLPINLATENAYGIELSLTQDIMKWWKFTANANFYRAVIEGSYQGQDLFAEANTFSTRINSRWQVPKVFNAQLSFDYRSPRNNPQGRYKAIYAFDLGLNKDVLKGKGTVTFSIRDIFNTRRWRWLTEDEDFTRNGFYQRSITQYSLAFTYRLNQEKSKRGDRGGRQGSGNNRNGGGGF